MTPSKFAFEINLPLVSGQYFAISIQSAGVGIHHHTETGGGAFGPNCFQPPSSNDRGACLHSYIINPAN